MVDNLLIRNRRSNIFLVIAFITLSNCIIGQDIVLLTEVSSDTILQGNRFEVRFTIKNIQANFEAPDFRGLPIVSGPSMSSSMQIIGNNYSSAQTHAYQLLAQDVGEYFISPSYFATADTTYETPPFSIIVLPNPEEKIQRIKKYKVIGGLSDTMNSNKKNKSSTRRRKKIKL